MVVWKYWRAQKLFASHACHPCKSPTYRGRQNPLREQQESVLGLRNYRLEPLLPQHANRDGCLIRRLPLFHRIHVGSRHIFQCHQPRTDVEERFPGQVKKNPRPLDGSTRYVAIQIGHRSLRRDKTDMRCVGRSWPLQSVCTQYGRKNKRKRRNRNTEPRTMQ